MVLRKDDVLSYGSVYITANNLEIDDSIKNRMLNTLKRLVADRVQHNIIELFEKASVFNEDFISAARVSNPQQLFSITSY